LTRRLNRLRGHTVILHTRDGQSIRGVLTGVHVDCLLLENGEHLGDATVEIAGRTVVPRENFSWLQVPS
jgi:small nuclear ribonucleoprotein (snRNP)-like protein